MESLGRWDPLGMQETAQGNTPTQCPATSSATDSVPDSVPLHSRAARDQ